MSYRLASSLLAALLALGPAASAQHAPRSLRAVQAAAPPSPVVAELRRIVDATSIPHGDDTRTHIALGRAVR